jgi:hypothetical protein
MGFDHVSTGAADGCHFIFGMDPLFHNDPQNVFIAWTGSAFKPSRVWGRGYESLGKHDGDLGRGQG